jgi:hypothetical protein
MVETRLCNICDFVCVLGCPARSCVRLTREIRYSTDLSNPVCDAIRTEDPSARPFPYGEIFRNIRRLPQAQTWIARISHRNELYVKQLDAKRCPESRALDRLLSLKGIWANFNMACLRQIIRM